MSAFAAVGSPMPSPRSLRVLVVDDDEFMLDVASELLLQMGITDVRRASDGAEALKSIGNAFLHPDVILCDLDMAGMDGFVLIRHLADRLYSGSVIIMSGSDERVLTSVTELGREHGLQLVDSLSKPLDPKRLSQAFDRVSARNAQIVSPDLKPEQNGFIPDWAGDALSPIAVRLGIDSGCVEIAVQPKVRLSDRHVVGAEALLRWRDPKRGILSPMAIVPAAESYGLIDDLALAVYRLSVDALADWRREGHDLKISVNLSAKNLTTLAFPEVLAAMAKEAGVETGCITLEITESRLLENLSTSLEVIGRLRLMGFNMSIDDFGTGYASMASLKSLPFTELKIDRSFVYGALNDTNDRASQVILGCSIELGHALQLDVVAEGVETAEEWNLLEALGCDEIQGYFVAKPMHPGDFVAWKTAWDANPPERRVVRPAGGPAWRA